MKVKDRGIVLAKSMEAKKYGISTAETIYMARKKCPGIKVYDGLKYSKYREYSDKLYNLLLQYTDIIERYSIDECFLDMTHFLQKDSLLDKAYEINKRVKREFGFTVNIGVAHNKLLAKMASDFTKPDRVHTLYEDEIESKMWGLPVSELFMLGRKTVPKLYSMGIKTIGEFAFEYCNKLKYTNLPNSITSIGRYAYFECESLETIWLPDSITAINAGTFGYCTSLKDITFSQKITSIGESAFIACTSLESIYIPASITYIERWSFMNCTNLNSVYCEGETPPAIPYTVFTNISPEILYVPIGCTEKYKEGGWNIFQTIIEMDFSANN